MIEKPEAAARAMADMLCASSYADAAAERNAITRRLLEFYDAGASTCLSRIERLESLLRRCGLRLMDDPDMRDEINEALRHDHNRD